MSHPYLQSPAMHIKMRAILPHPTDSLGSLNQADKIGSQSSLFEDYTCSSNKKDEMMMM